jgi:glutamate-ammonia-ligase adenylyltransferase
MDAFAAYQANEAWTWEHMALTRARPIAGDAVLLERARQVIGTILRKPRDHGKVIADVLDMRAMIEAAKGGEGPWGLKQAPGGLVDIEFIAQSLQLLHAAEHPEIVSTDTETSIVMAASVGVLAAAEADVLLPALGLLSALIQVLRLSVEHGFVPGKAPTPLLDRLAEAADVPDFRSLEAHLRATQSEVRASFERVLGKVPSAPRR